MVIFHSYVIQSEGAGNFPNSPKNLTTLRSQLETRAANFWFGLALFSLCLTQNPTHQAWLILFMNNELEQLQDRVS